MVSVRRSLVTYGFGIAAVACAVAFLIAGSMAANAFRGSFISSNLGAPLDTTAVVSAEERIPDAVAGDGPGVPVLGSAAALVGPDGAAISSPGTLAVADDRLVRVVSGRLPQNPQEVALDPFLANLAEVEPGQQVQVAGPDGSPIPLMLVGLTRPAFGNEQQVVLTQQMVQTVAGDTGWLRVLLFDDAATNAVAVDQMAARNTDPALVLTLETPDQAGGDSDLGVLAGLLYALFVVVLVASVFVISNSFAAVAESRRQHTALLRVIGASRTQVRNAMTLEGILIGAIGVAIGVVAGTLIGRLVSGQLLFPLWPSARLVLISSLVGMIVTVLAVWSPARQAGRTSPLNAMRGAAVASVEPLPVLRAALALPLIIAVALVIQVPLAGAVLGGALGFLTLVVLGPWLAPRLATSLVRGSSLSARLARANIQRNPRRSARTAAALMLGIGLAAAGTAVATALGNLNSLDDRYRVAVVAPTISEPLASDLLDIPGVDSVSGIGTSFTEVGIGPDGDNDQIRTATEAVIANYPGARLATTDDFRTRYPLSEVLGRGIGVMSLLALVVGIIGVVNAVTLGVWERQRELAVLRALGVEQRQVRGLIVREAAGLTTIGVTFGLMLAAVTIYGLLGVATVLILPFISWWLVALVCAVTIVAGIVSAWLPARLASEVPPTRALVAVE
jgi:cell division protein FtsX